MLDQELTIDASAAEAEIDEHTASLVYYQLPDGRMVPVEMGGMVEFAMFELGARLIDTTATGNPGSSMNLN